MMTGNNKEQKSMKFEIEKQQESATPFLALIVLNRFYYPKTP